jgi:hypothetical protein
VRGRSRPTGPAACAALSVTALVLLRVAATGELAPPPPVPGEAIDRWLVDRPPAVAALAVLRLGTEVVVWCVLAVLTVHALAGATRRLRDLGSWTGDLAGPATGHLLTGCVGLGLATASLPDEAPAAEAVRALGRTPTPVFDSVPADQGTATMRPTPGGGAARGAGGSARGSAGGGTATAAPRSVPPVPVHAVTPSTWRVEPGESFWSMAAEILEGAWGRPPDDGEIGPYWRDLVDLNRSRLVNGDPDLVLPGQVFEVPRPPLPRAT